MASGASKFRSSLLLHRNIDDIIGLSSDSLDLYSHCTHKREIKGVTNKSSKMLLKSEEKGKGGEEDRE
jgi:hypothetical protein